MKTKLLPIISIIFAAITVSCDFDDLTNFCGDGMLDTNEECDDGNTVNGDGCSSTCKKEASSTPPVSTPVCGNRIVETGEGCDDGNTLNGDGCSSNCQVETSQPVHTTPVCGNGKVETGEDCDDGNTVSGDGCSSACKKESTPSPEPSCPKEGDSCTGKSSMCCDNNVYDCVSGHYEVIVCKGNAYCDSAEGFYDCAEPCTSNEADIDFLGYDDYCYDGEFELFACQKGDSGKYGIFGGYYAQSYCWGNDAILECDEDGTVGEFECSVCTEGTGNDPYVDICEAY